MSTVADYFGRRYDVSAFQGQRASGDVETTQALAYDAAQGGSICTGIVRLAQWFIVELLTIRGSAIYDPDRGTSFLPKLLSGQVRTDTDVFQVFGFAVGDIRARSRLIEGDDWPDDERFDDASISRLVRAPGYIELHVAVSSMAGASRDLILPIQTVY